VIKLDKEAMSQDRRLLKANPNMKEDSFYCYVGQTSRTPDERFEQHKQGYKSKSYVKRYGMYLCRKRYEKYNPIATREEAWAMEESLAEKLRKKRARSLVKIIKQAAEWHFYRVMLSSLRYIPPYIFLFKERVTRLNSKSILLILDINK